MQVFGRFTLADGTQTPPATVEEILAGKVEGVTDEMLQRIADTFVSALLHIRYPSYKFTIHDKPAAAAGNVAVGE